MGEQHHRDSVSDPPPQQAHVARPPSRGFKQIANRNLENGQIWKRIRGNAQADWTGCVEAI